MKIEHVAMYVKNLDASKDFFVKYFDGRANKLYHNVRTGFQSYFICFDDGARLEIMRHPAMQDMEKPLTRTGLAHIAFSVGSVERVNELTEQLKADGYSLVSGPRVTGDGYYESCVVDLEGNIVEITV